MRNQKKKKARMALKINLINNQRCYKLPKKQLKYLSVFILRSQGIKATEVNILFTDNKKIKELNKKFCRKDKATDVLSFYEGLANLNVPFVYPRRR